ncbi:MAG TPA: hypothetical protein VLD67_22375, partial [Vicinamibacterales bacterium]|nr:hypothetical protein [Vicinamibacterales bacterium]
LYLWAGGFAHHVLRSLGFRAQRFAGRGHRFLAQTIQRLGRPRAAVKEGCTRAEGDQEKRA